MQYIEKIYKSSLGILYNFSCQSNYCKRINDGNISYFLALLQQRYKSNNEILLFCTMIQCNIKNVVEITLFNIQGKNKNNTK